MSDSQKTDYLEITQSLLANKRQWKDTSEIVSLTFKAVSHLLRVHSQSFSQHKTLINEQSLKIKELQLRLGSKINKKDVEAEVIHCLKSNSFFQRRDEDSLSQYDKLVRESRFERDRNDTVTAEQMKTISEIIADKKITQFQKSIQAKTIAQRLELQQKVSQLQHQLNNKLTHTQRQMRELRDKVIEYKIIQSRIEQQSHKKSTSSLNQQKITYLQHSQKRFNQSLNHIITHIQTNYFTKDEFIKIVQGLKNSPKQKSPIKPKSKEEGKSKYLKEEQTDVGRIIDHHFSKLKEKQAKEWTQFKQYVLKQIGKMVQIQVVNNLIDSFQKEVLQKFYSLSNSVNKLQSKIQKSHENTSKQVLVKSQKRTQKRSSPNKSIESIQTSLTRLEKTLTDKNHSQFRKFEHQVQQKIKRFDIKMISQLDRRQKHLCQVIQQTYQSQNHLTNEKQLKTAISTLYKSNMFCRYLYIGTKQCKKQAYIPWDNQVLNNFIENYQWKNQTILINGPGLYKVQFAMFGEIETDTHLLINSQPISIISKPQFLNTPSRKIKGNYYSEFLLLPSNSKLSFRVSQRFYGQAVLSIQKL